MRWQDTTHCTHCGWPVPSCKCGTPHDPKTGWPSGKSAYKRGYAVGRVDGNRMKAPFTTGSLHGKEPPDDITEERARVAYQRGYKDGYDSVPVIFSYKH